MEGSRCSSLAIRWIEDKAHCLVCAGTMFAEKSQRLKRFIRCLNFS